MSLQETTKENYCTPTIGTHAKCEGDTLNDTVDVSSGDEDLDDRGNAIEFHNLMKLKGHVSRLEAANFSGMTRTRVSIKGRINLCC